MVLAVANCLRALAAPHYIPITSLHTEYLNLLVVTLHTEYLNWLVVALHTEYLNWLVVALHTEYLNWLPGSVRSFLVFGPLGLRLSRNIPSRFAL